MIKPNPNSRESSGSLFHLLASLGQLDDKLELFFDDRLIENYEEYALGLLRGLYEHGINLIYDRHNVKRPNRLGGWAHLMKSLLTFAVADLSPLVCPARLSHWLLAVLWVFRHEVQLVEGKEYQQAFAECWEGPVWPLDLIRWAKWVQVGTPLFTILHGAIARHPALAEALLAHLRPAYYIDVDPATSLLPLAMAIPIARRLAFIREKVGGLQGLGRMDGSPLSAEQRRGILEEIGSSDELSISYDGSLNVEQLMRFVEGRIRLTAEGEMYLCNKMTMSAIGALLAMAILFNRPLHKKLWRKQVEMLIVRPLRELHVKDEDLVDTFSWMDFTGEQSMPTDMNHIAIIRRGRVYAASTAFYRFLPHSFLLSGEETLQLIRFS